MSQPQRNASVSSAHVVLVSTVLCRCIEADTTAPFMNTMRQPVLLGASKLESAYA